MTVPKIHTEGSTPNQVALAYIAKKMRVLLATSDGYLFIYDLSSKFCSFFIKLLLLFV